MKTNSKNKMSCKVCGRPNIDIPAGGIDICDSCNNALSYNIDVKDNKEQLNRIEGRLKKLLSHFGIQMFLHDFD